MLTLLGKFDSMVEDTNKQTTLTDSQKTHKRLAKRLSHLSQNDSRPSEQHRRPLQPAWGEKGTCRADRPLWEGGEGVQPRAAMAKDNEGALVYG